MSNNDHTVLVGGEEPEYNKLKWGSFTNQFNAYNQKNPRNKMNSLKEFAQMVVANPDKFAKKTEKRARFYLNVILKGGAKKKLGAKLLSELADYEKDIANEKEPKQLTEEQLQAEMDALQKEYDAENPSTSHGDDLDPDEYEAMLAEYAEYEGGKTRRRKRSGHKRSGHKRSYRTYKKNSTCKKKSVNKKKHTHRKKRT